MEKNYGSHLPLLKYIFSMHTFNSCIEFGLGEHSTKFFLSQNLNLITIENDIEWINNFKNVFSLSHKIIFHKNENVEEVLDSELKNLQFDLAFVDGPRNSRWKCVNKLANHCKIIIVHDTNKSTYSWEKINLPQYYQEFIYKLDKTWTTVFSSDMDLNRKLLDSEVVTRQ